MNIGTQDDLGPVIFFNIILLFIIPKHKRFEKYKQELENWTCFFFIYKRLMWSITIHPTILYLQYIWMICKKEILLSYFRDLENSI